PQSLGGCEVGRMGTPQHRVDQLFLSFGQVAKPRIKEPDMPRPEQIFGWVASIIWHFSSRDCSTDQAKYAWKLPIFRNKMGTGEFSGRDAVDACHFDKAPIFPRGLIPCHHKHVSDGSDGYLLWHPGKFSKRRWAGGRLRSGRLPVPRPPRREAVWPDRVYVANALCSPQVYT